MSVLSLIKGIEYQILRREYKNKQTVLFLQTSEIQGFIAQ